MARWVKSVLVTGLGCMAGTATMAVAHVHGMARLDVAVEKGRVVLALHGAGDNFVGFEHAAQTPEQVATVRAAEAHLQALDELLVIGTGCARESVRVTLPENLNAAREGNTETEHAAVAGDGAEHVPSHDDHDHNHDHDSHHDHEDAADARHPSDWWIHASFSCTGDTSGTRLQARRLFDAFPRLQELRVQAIGADGQAGAALTSDAATLVLP